MVQALGTTGTTDVVRTEKRKGRKNQIKEFEETGTTEIALLAGIFLFLGCGVGDLTIRTSSVGKSFTTKQFGTIQAGKVRCKVQCGGLATEVAFRMVKRANAMMI